MLRTYTLKGQYVGLVLGGGCHSHMF